MKYQAILFDMDGTLLDTLTDMQAAVNYILEKYGYPTRTLEEVRRFVGNGAGPLIHRALPQGVDPDREAEILADYRAYYQAHNCVETRPYDGIGPLLERLRQAGGRRGCPTSRTGPPGPWRPGSSRSWTGPWASGRASPPSPPRIWSGRLWTSFTRPRRRLCM